MAEPVKKWGEKYFSTEPEVFHLIEIAPGSNQSSPRLLVVRYLFASQKGHRLVAKGTRKAMETAKRLMEVPT